MVELIIRIFSKSFSFSLFLKESREIIIFYYVSTMSIATNFNAIIASEMNKCKENSYKNFIR